ncbi:hypothetical protein [Gloeobacter kilaueensis]|uniref:hypothetical protein n=1 Tax=Gloeobacter kilaueensis TaxID=1416614 RepID=UPI000404F95F|nr:hypothetical protein [Gloeobacter kilaueensis]
MDESTSPPQETWISQARLAELFGLPVPAMGTVLQNLGLKAPPGQPSALAHEQQLCCLSPLADGAPVYLWHQQKLLELLAAQGLSPLTRQQMRCREFAEGLIQADREFKSATSPLEEKAALLLRSVIYEQLGSTDIALVNRFLGDFGSELRLPPVEP